MKKTRSLPISLDFSVFERLRKTHQATQQQAEMAYRRALKRTAVTLRKLARTEMKNGLEPRSATEFARRRIRLYSKSASGVSMAGFKLFFGLDGVPVGWLRGRIRVKEAPRHSLRDPRTGRYIAGRAASEEQGEASFIPAGNLPRKDVPGGFTGKKHRGQPSVFRRKNGVVIEESVQIYDEMSARIETELNPQVLHIFMRHYESELRSRVRMKIR